MTQEKKTTSKKGIIVGIVAALIASIGIGVAVLTTGSTPETITTQPQPTPTTPSPVAETPTVDFTACALIDSSNEKGVFDDALVSGLDQVKKALNIASNVYPAGDITTSVESAISDGCGVIFIASLQTAYEVKSIAADYPDVNFVMFDTYEEIDLPNVKLVNYDMSQSSFLAGYLAAAQSDSKIVGTFGGFNLPVTSQYMDGFYNGALTYGNDNDVEVTVVGWNPNTQSGAFIETFAPNSTAAADIANQMVAAGVDVIFPIAGDQYEVIIDAYTRAGVDGMIVGVDADLALTRPEYAPYVLTSVEKVISQPLSDMVEKLIAGEEFTSDPYRATVTNGGTQLSPFYEFETKISEEDKTRLDEIRQNFMPETVQTAP